MRSTFNEVLRPLLQSTVEDSKGLTIYHQKLNLFIRNAFCIAGFIETFERQRRRAERLIVILDIPCERTGTVFPLNAWNALNVVTEYQCLCVSTSKRIIAR